MNNVFGCLTLIAVLVVLGLSAFVEMLTGSTTIGIFFGVLLVGFVFLASKWEDAQKRAKREKWENMSAEEKGKEIAGKVVQKALKKLFFGGD